MRVGDATSKPIIRRLTVSLDNSNHNKFDKCYNRRHPTSEKQTHSESFVVSHMLSFPINLKFLGDHRAETEMKRDHNNETSRCKKLLEECEMFQKVPPTGLTAIAEKMKHRVLDRNEILLYQSKIKQ